MNWAREPTRRKVPPGPGRDDPSSGPQHHQHDRHTLPGLKAYAHATPGVLNASVEFNLKTLRPTYHLTIGLPRPVKRARHCRTAGAAPGDYPGRPGRVNPTDLRAEDLLDEIHRQRDLARQAREAADAAQRDAESIRNELADRLDRIEVERYTVMEAARQSMEDELETLREQWKHCAGS